MKALLAIILAALCSGAAVASQRRPAPADRPLSAAHRRWLEEEVAYIVTMSEGRAFRRLATDAARERFIQSFWRRRDPTPGTERNETREEHYARIAHADARFSFRGTTGWKTDRGRVYVILGKPDETERHPKSERFSSFEVWFYRSTPYGKGVEIEFRDAGETGDFRLYVPDRPRP